jgi:hypothetical protein
MTDLLGHQVRLLPNAGHERRQQQRDEAEHDQGDVAHDL